MKKWTFGVTMLVTASCFAADLQYNPQYEADAYQWETLVRDARTCMRGMAMSYLRAGARDMETIVNSATLACGIQLRPMLASVPNLPPASIDPFIRAMAYDELGKIPGVVFPKQGK
jgi:hypothetical protein